MYLTLNRRSESEKRKTELVDVLESVSYQLCGEDDISVDVFYEVTLLVTGDPVLESPLQTKGCKISKINKTNI